MFRILTYTLLWITFTAIHVEAQTPTLKDVLKEETPEEKEEKPSKKVHEGTPRAGIKAFLDAAEQGEYEKAAQYLDLRSYSDQGPEIAQQLKVIFDRALWIDLDALSDSKEGFIDDDLVPNRDLVGRVDFHDKKVDILIQKIKADDGSHTWKIAFPTVTQIPKLYTVHGYGVVGEYLAHILPSYEFMGLQTWQWAMLAVLAFCAYCVAFIITRIASFILFYRRITPFREQLNALISGPIRFLIMVILVRSFIDLIRPSMVTRALIEGETLLILVSLWTIIVVINILRDHIADTLRKKGSETAIVLLHPAANTLKIIVAVIALLVWMENLGFKATTLLTGLGIGGLAFALAAQKSIENLIGAVTLYASAPVRIGDFCRFGDQIGTVEEIGLRYTRIRTLDNSVVNVANALFVDTRIENLSERRKIRFHPDIKLSRRTTPDQIRYILVEIRKILYSHPKVDPEPARVRFKTFGDYSMDIAILAYIPTRNYTEFLEVAEDLNLRIMDVIATAGATLAVPTQKVWVERSKEKREESIQSTEEKVREWRDKGELYLPKFPDEEIEKLRGSIQYPAK